MKEDAISEEAMSSWERLAKSTAYLLDHPDTPQGMFHAIEHFADSILPPDETAGAHYGRRILAMAKGIAGRKAKRQRRTDDLYEDHCQDFGECPARILGYDHTPKAVRTAGAELCSKFEEWARREKAFAHSKARVRTMLPELMILASYCDIVEMGAGGDAISPQSEAVM